MGDKMAEVQMTQQLEFIDCECLSSVSVFKFFLSRISISWLPFVILSQSRQYFICISSPLMINGSHLVQD